MNLLSIKEEWRNKFGEALPVGFSCRQFLRDFWLRLHSLPGSRRYAESEQDMADIIHLQNEIGDYVLGDKEKCIIVATWFGERNTQSHDISLPGPISLKHFMSHKEDDDDIQFFVAEVIWQKGSFDDLFLAVADDRSFPVLFANMSRRSIFAPYDGGSDLFFSTDTEVTVARENFSRWVSSREDGL